MQYLISKTIVHSLGGMNFVATEETWKILYKYLLDKENFINSKQIMEELQFSKTTFYNALDHLREFKLIEAKVDADDLRKISYRAIVSQL